MIHFHRRRRRRPTMPRRLTQFPLLLLLPFFFFSVFQVFYSLSPQKQPDYIDSSSKLMRIEVRSCCVRFQQSSEAQSARISSKPNRKVERRLANCCESRIKPTFHSLFTAKPCAPPPLSRQKRKHQKSILKSNHPGWLEILKIQKFRRVVSYTGFYCFTALLTYMYTNNTTRAGYSRADQFYASYPAGTELLTDQSKLYKVALANCFEEEEWGPIEWSIMAKHFERQGKSPYAYHAQYMAHLVSNGQIDGSG